MECVKFDYALLATYQKMSDEQLMDYADNHFSGPTGRELAHELARRLRQRKGVENVETTAGED